MPDASNSVIRLTMRFDQTILAVGTGVLYEHTGNTYIVTAWHNFTGRHTETFSCLSQNQAIPNNVIAEIPFVSGQLVARIGLSIPLFDHEKASFLIHPKNWPRIDVVAIPFDQDEIHMLEATLPDGSTLKFPFQRNREEPVMEVCPVQNFEYKHTAVDLWFKALDVAEELYIPGFPENISDVYGSPVWKRATTASSPRQGWNKEPKFLVDCASKGGMSGAPVFYHNNHGQIRVNGNSYSFSTPASILTGIYVGRIGGTTEFEAQIGVVWHRSVINEIIEGGTYEKHPDYIQASLSQIREATQRTLSMYTQENIEEMRCGKHIYVQYASKLIWAAVEGRTDMEVVRAELLEALADFRGPFKAKQSQIDAPNKPHPHA